MGEAEEEDSTTTPLIATTITVLVAGGASTVIGLLIRFKVFVYLFVCSCYYLFVINWVKRKKGDHVMNSN